MRAVLFDLDGTLLDIDIDAFMNRYLTALANFSESLYPGRGFMDAMMAGVHEMMGVHPGATNQEAFAETVRVRSGVDLDSEWDAFETFYGETFDGLRGSAGPRDGALDALDAALELGAKVAIATNPMFPRIAIEKRMAWAGVDGRHLDTVTTYEDYFACKPHAAYFRQIADELAVEPAECLMVGDDARLDMPAGDIGMKTFYVGRGRAPEYADRAGDMTDVAAFIRETFRQS